MNKKVTTGLAAMALAFGGLTISAAPAAAHDGSGWFQYFSPRYYVCTYMPYMCR